MSRINFEDDGYGTIPTWKFQDSPDLTDLPVVDDPSNPENHIAAYVDQELSNGQMHSLFLITGWILLKGII